MRRSIVTLGAVAIAAVIASVAAGCAEPASAPSARPSPSTSPTTTLAAESTRTEIVSALGARSIGVERAQAPFRPPESPLLQAAPRLVLEAFLPDDPQAGQIVVYEFGTAADAASAGREMAQYIASGPGRVNFTPDAEFVLRQVGPTLVFYSYAPGSLTNPGSAAAVAEGLATIGLGIEVPG
jgi:hypothetical protein